MPKSLTQDEVQANLDRLQYIIAVRKHTLGVTDSCPACEQSQD